MKKVYVIAGCVLMIAGAAMCRKPNASVLDDDSKFDPRLSGGLATYMDVESGGSTGPIAGLSARDARVHDLGDQLFEQSFVAAPAPRFGGLGPVFNNVSCANCHHNDGFGEPSFGKLGSSLLMRVSLPGQDEHGGPLALPGFGGQLQNVALVGVQPEATVELTYTEQSFSFADGEKAMLRTPAYSLINPYMPLPAGYLTSPRLGPTVFGLGLLENVPERTILSYTDPTDANGDGIRGRANYVYDPYTHKTEIGRFGKKANTSSLLVQVATAFQQDMGLTSYVQPKKSVWGQSQMASVPESTTPDLADSMLNAVVFYVRTLSVPARRNTNNETVKRGEAIFKQINCAACHVPTMYTGVVPGLPALSGQRIHPYTDMLIHDMGEGLADHRPDYLATGTDWRTPPLWGIGMFEKNNGTPYYLHDGRARTVTEAILWHGGEAQRSRDQFTQLSKTDRAAVLAFLQSL